MKTDVNVVTIKPNEFFLVLKSVEKKNLIQPTNKILIMRYEKINPQSPQSGILLNNYYYTLQKNPQMGFSLQEFKSLIQNNKNSNNEIQCAYCKQCFPEDKITIDHFKPRALKGLNQFYNIRLACAQCNVMKGCIYPEKMPYTYELFLSKAIAKEYVSSLNILREISNNINLDITERQLLTRLINMEVHWRNTKGYAEKSNKPQILTNQE